MDLWFLVVFDVIKQDKLKNFFTYVYPPIFLMAKQGLPWSTCGQFPCFFLFLDLTEANMTFQFQQFQQLVSGVRSQAKKKVNKSAI